LGLAAVSALFIVFFAGYAADQLLFAPREAQYDAQTDGIHLISASDGTQLAVYWGPVEGAEKTVFYFHGNAEDIGDISFILQNYRLQGVNALSYDYRGYGLSGGAPSEDSCYADAARVLEYAADAFGIDLSKVVYHGRSLGGGIALEMAVERPGAGLILESSFLSAFRLYLPLTRLPGDRFENYRKASKLEGPLLVIHGEQDRLVPFEHGETLARLATRAQTRRLWIGKAGHNDLQQVAAGDYWAAIRSFCSSL